MFKSILGRLFWTYAIILMLVFTSVAVTVGIFVNHFAISTHMNNVISVSQNLEYWTGSLQIEDTDYRARAAYKQLLRSWGSFLNSDIIVTNSNGEVLESTTSSATVPDELVHIVTNGNIVKKYSTLNGSYKNKMMVIITSLFSVLAAFVLVYMQSKKISKPIEEINKAARGIASGKFDKRVEVTSTDEIGQLASSLIFAIAIIAFICYMLFKPYKESNTLKTQRSVSA